MAKKIGYHNTIIDVLTGKGQEATITIFDAGIENKSTIYSNSSGSAKSNPFDTDVYGRFSFFADPGEYDIQVSGKDIITYKIEGITISALSLPPENKNRITNFYYDPDLGRIILEYNDNL